MVSDSVRAARRIRGCLKTRGQVVPGGIVLWTEEGAGAWKADSSELSEDLALLGVPHYSTHTGRCQPPWRSAATKEPPCRWEKIWIVGADFGHLAEAIPALAALEVPPPEPPRDMAVVRLEDGRAGYAVGGELLGKTVGSPYLGP
jgi:hypothetical protein